MQKKTQIRQIPAYSPINAQALLSQINNIYIATKQLEENDKVRYESSIGISTYGEDIIISESLIRQILTREIIRNEGIRLVKVKNLITLGNQNGFFTMLAT